jgi:uncharacterized damage-inducible protein DinB
MIETPQQYTDRILSFSDGRDGWEILESSPARARELAQNLTPSQLDHQTAPGRWSVRQILAHLADCEVVAAWRLRAILAEDGVPLQPFDQNAWASVFRYDRVDVSESLDVFAILRRANLRLLRSVDPALHQNAGMHQERGRESIDHLIRLYAGHDLNHLTQIDRLVRSLREAERSG